MQFREKAKRLLSWKAIIGWVALIKPLWNWISTISTIEWVVSAVSPLWNYLSGAAGDKVLLFIGFAFLFWAVLRPTKTKNIEPNKQTSRYDETTEKILTSLHQEIDTLNSEVAPYREIMASQKGHEEQWLNPVIAWIDFNRDWLSSKEVMLKYSIDSGLVYDFKPHRMWLKLKIGQYEPKDGWEVLPPPNLLKGKRNQFASDPYTINDDRLLKRVDQCRQGLKTAQTIKIIAQLRDGEELRELGQSYSINQYSDYVQEAEQ